MAQDIRLTPSCAIFQSYAILKKPRTFTKKINSDLFQTTLGFSGQNDSVGLGTTVQTKSRHCKTGLLDWAPSLLLTNCFLSFFFWYINIV